MKWRELFDAFSSPVKSALFALKVSGTVIPRHFGFLIRSRFHSTTSSASDSTLSENLIPSVFAVLRLITNSNLVDW